MCRWLQQVLSSQSEVNCQDKAQSSVQAALWIFLLIPIKHQTAKCCNNVRDIFHK